MVTIHMGPCSQCKQPAEFGRQLSCGKCATLFDRLCKIHRKKPCPKCGGTLLLYTDVFPHSLFDAIQRGDTDQVQRLVRLNDVDFNSVLNPRGESALACAARQGKAGYKMVTSLLRVGASPHSKIGARRTPLMQMVFFRKYDYKIAEELRSSVNDQDSAGMTALMFAASGKSSMAQRRGNIDIARRLLQLGADPAIVDTSGRTALGHAIAANDTQNNGEMIQFLKAEAKLDLAMKELNDRGSVDFDDKGVARLVLYKDQQSPTNAKSQGRRKPKS